jgi:uncharacterized protein YgiB involved in biofilm formation
MSGGGMKRSRTVSLLVMGLTPLFIGGCDGTKKSQQEFTSLDACEQAGVPMSVCQGAYSKAQADASRLSPHYSSEAACGGDYEQITCDEIDNENGSAYWRPDMYAFLVARVIRDGQTSYYPAGPIFRKKDLSDYSPQYGNVYSGGGSGGSYSGGSGSWRSVSSDEVAGEGDTVSRGGFGGGEGEGGHGE